jgi:hypothetical protein
MFTLLFLVFLYFLPAIIAAHRDHPSRTSILIVNTFLGFTVIGWVICLIWSLSGYRQVEYVPYCGYVARR